jgi:hypothetical protein
LLPGEQLWGPSQVSSLIWGTNDSVEYTSNNVETVPSVQQYLEQAHVGFVRTVFRDQTPDSEIQARVQALQTLGATGLCLFEEIDNLALMEHQLSVAGGKANCPMVEFGNELDWVSGYGTTGYMAAWNVDIPQLRAMFPGVLFGGPTSIGVSSGLMQGFIQSVPSSGVFPDFVSFHEYPCLGAASQADCLSPTSSTGVGQFDYDYRTALGWEQQYWGHTVPTGISEWNFDPGGANLSNWYTDQHFMWQFTEAAMQVFVTDKFAFANEYSSLNFSDYGMLDMFNDTGQSGFAPYAPLCQFWAMADMGKKNGSGSTLTIPTC